MALSAEYGEFWPSAISLTGRICTISRPAEPSHPAKRGRSRISPMPQLSREGIEKRGTSAPACRPVANRPGSGIGPLQNLSHALGEHMWLREQGADGAG